MNLGREKNVGNKFLQKLLKRINYQHLNIKIRYKDFKAANTYNLYFKFFPASVPLQKRKKDRWQDRSLKCYVGNMGLGGEGEMKTVKWGFILPSWLSGVLYRV